MNDETPEDLGHTSHRATIRGVRYTLIGLIIAAASLAWTVGHDVFETSKGNNATTSEAEPADDTEAEKETTSHEEGPPNDGFKHYFYRAQNDYENWRMEQHWWQLTLWWVAAYATGMALAAYFESWLIIPAAAQLLYLAVFWSSLTGLGIIVSTLLWIAIPGALMIFVLVY